MPEWWKNWFQCLASKRAEVLGMNARNIEVIFPHNRRCDFPLANHKGLSKSLLIKNEIPVPKTLLMVTSFLELADLELGLEQWESFVMKPAQGSGGSGIMVVTRAPDGSYRSPSNKTFSKSAIMRQASEILFGSYSNNRSDFVLVEEKLNRHSFFDKISSPGLPDFRVIVFKGKAIMSMLRLPTKASRGTANLHQGGVGVGITMEGGVSNGATHKGKRISSHPDTGAELVGLPIPDWSEILNLLI